MLFGFFAPSVWNSLPVGIHESQSLPTFRRHLKTFYFQSAFSCPPCLEYLRLRTLILLRVWRYVSRVLIYLLTYLLMNRVCAACVRWESSSCMSTGGFQSASSFCPKLTCPSCQELVLRPSSRYIHGRRRGVGVVTGVSEHPSAEV